MTRPILASKAVPWFVLAVCAAAAVGLACAKPEGAAPEGGSAAPAAMTRADSLALGKRMTTVAGCNDCHTPGTFYGSMDTTRTLAGSEVGWTGPWGTSYPRNLTPDAETGIGTWTADQIVIALREGRRPDGTPLLPPMPWPMYVAFTDVELYSIAAYLKSLPAVSHAVPKVVPPGQKATTPTIVIPPPGQWDAPKSPPPAG